MFDFIKELSESKLFPSKLTLDKVSDNDLRRWVFMMLCALSIMGKDDHCRNWVKDYCRKTVRQNQFDDWRSDGTDLYLAIYALHKRECIKISRIKLWLKDLSEGRLTTDKRFFTSLGEITHVNDSVLMTIRRHVLNWDDLSRSDRKDTVRRLQSKMKIAFVRSEVLTHFNLYANRHDYDDLSENATSGSTSCGSVATVTGALGSGFDPSGHDRSIYGKPKKKKPIILRR